MATTDAAAAAAATSAPVSPPPSPPPRALIASPPLVAAQHLCVGSGATPGKAAAVGGNGRPSSGCPGKWQQQRQQEEGTAGPSWSSSSGSSFKASEAPQEAAAQAVVTPPPRPTFFSRACGRSLVTALLLYCGALGLATLLAHAERHLGLVLLSLLPALFSMGYMQRLFSRSVLRSEMLCTFFATMAWMAPLVVLENAAYFGVLTRSSLEAQGSRHHSTAAITWGYKLLSAFVRAYPLAALFEEAAKYLALRRLRRAPHVTDPRALVAYGLCAGAAFGTVEDLFIYAFAYGIDNTLARAFLSVPLHCMTGLLMGLSLAHDRFRHPGSRPWHRVLALPVFLHGTFDAVNFLLDGTGGVAAALAVEVLVVLGGLVLVRRRLVALLRRHPVEHDLQGLLLRAARGDKLAVAEAKTLTLALPADRDGDGDCEDEGGHGGRGGLVAALRRVASGKGLRRSLSGNSGSGSGSGSGRSRAGSGDGYQTDLDLSSSTLASSSCFSSPSMDTEEEEGMEGMEGLDLEAGGAEAAAPAPEAAAVVVVGPSRKEVVLTAVTGCVLSAGMLAFLYLVRL